MNGTVVPACVHHGDIVTGGVDLSAEPTANSVAARRIRFRMVPGGYFHLRIDEAARERGVQHGAVGAGSWSLCRSGLWWWSYFVGRVRV